MGNYGIKISKEGIPVEEAGLKDLILHSSYPLLKIKEIVSGSTSLTDSISGFEVDIYHNLGYIPKFFIISTHYDPFSDIEITSYQLMPLTMISAGGVIALFYTIEVDDEKITFSGATWGGDNDTHTINYRCFIYYDED
jgi:hypothetical protein